MGNQFIINCKVGIADKPINSIHDTIDYCHLLNIIKKHFSVPTPLLETLAQKIETECTQHFPFMKYFYISLQKKSPAMNAELLSSEIILEKSYENK